MMHTDTIKDGRIRLDGTRLKHLRRDLGLSQERLARHCMESRCPVSLSSIKRAELGHPVLYRTASSLAQFYRHPLADLLINPNI